MREKKVHLGSKPAGYLGTFAIGMTFAAGWTPCIGPILGSILLVASAKGSAVYGIKLLSVYSLGLSVPFFLSSLAINSFLSHSKKFQKHMRVIMIFSGLLLIAFGVIMLTDRLKDIARFIPQFGI